MKKRTLFVLLLCILFVNSSVNAAQVRKRSGYLTTAAAGARMVTSYYLVNDNGSRISTQEYDYLERVTPNLFIAKINNKYGLISGSGTRKVSFEYDEIKCLKYGVFRVKENGKYGLMDYNGNIFLSMRYSYLEKIDDRLLKMSSGSSTLDPTGGSAALIGLMDYSGRIISHPKYLYVDKINNYMLRVLVNSAATQTQAVPTNPANPAAQPAQPTTGTTSGSGKKYGIIDYYGRTILSPQYDYIAKVNNTILRVKKGASWGRVEYYKGNIINIMFDYQSYW